MRSEYINPIKKREISFCIRHYPRNIMRLHLTFLLIIGAAVADHHHAWESGNEYHFLIRSRTLTVLDKLAEQFSGILMRGALTIQVISPDTLQAVVSKTQYAPVHKSLPKGWDSEIADLEYEELSLSGKSFKIKLKHGVIREMLIDQDVPTWEVNLLKSIVSQLQIDTQGENAIATRGTQVPDDDQPFGTFKAMEDSVGGKCEVLYDITPMPEDVLLKKPELVPLPNLRKDGRHFDITKTKNYTRCEQRMVYHFGITDKMNWKPGTNNELLSRSSTSRILISGNLKHFTIQSSVTTNKIFINSKLHDTYSGAVYSRMNLTLDRMSKISNPMPPSNNLVSTGNLVYIYNNPFSSQRKLRQPSISQSSLAARSSESRSSNSSSEESSSGDDSSSSSSSSSSISNNEERDYLQPKPKLDEAPESPLLPYFVGYKGKSIQKSEEDYAVVAFRLIDQITEEIEYFSVKMFEQPFGEASERYIILTRLIRTMNVIQIAEVESKLLHQDNRNRYSNKEDQKFYNQTAWDVFYHAVANAGTGPALITIKNWIKNRKLEGIQAAAIISKIPKSARTPTVEYVRAFFELITDEQVTTQRFLNTTAPLSFAELVRYTQSNKSSVYYPVYSFGRMISKNDNALLETYIPYMATQLREAIKDGDSVRIQTYIMALGNFGHAKILSVFEPYLEGTLPVSKFQRMMMVISLSRLSESFPRIARSVAYKIYVNVMEAYEIRCAAVYIIMKTNPPLGMLQRMAEFTNQDEDRHVNTVVKTTIDALANLKQPELQDLANKARIAKKLLSPQYYGEKYSQSIIEDKILASLNIAQTSIIYALGSDDTDIFKGAFFGVHQSYGGFNLPPMRIIFALSSIKQWLDMWYRVFENKSESKLIIEEITEKLGIKPEDAEQLEGNILMDSLFASLFYAFDNYTSEEVINMMKAYAMSTKIRAFESRNMNYLDQYDMTLGFPTESGLPFIYTLTIPKVMRNNAGLAHKIIGSSLELTTAGHILMNEKIQSRIGFVTPFEHRHYIAGIDINTQIYIPAGLSFKTEGKKKFELKIELPEYYRYGPGYMAIHHSVVPYTARHDILDLQPVLLSNNSRLVHTKEPHEMGFSIGDAIFGARSDLIDSTSSEKTGMEALTEIFNMFQNVGAIYRKFDVILNPMSAQVNITFNNFLILDTNSSVATIPEIVDQRPESEARREQFLKEVSKDINSATGHIFDISVSTKQKNHVFTLALADSLVDKKMQALFYWNVQSEDDGEVLLEFCTIGQMQSSRYIYLNLEEAIEQIPKVDINAEMRFGSCAYGETIRLKGSLTRTDDLKETIMKSEILEKCRQEMKQGNKGLLACQEAIALIQQRNHLLMSMEVDSVPFYMLANKIILMLKTSKRNVEMPGSASSNTFDLEMKLPLDSNSAIFLNTSMMDVTFSLEDFIPKDSVISKTFKNEEEELSCTLDKTQAVTFDDKVYPLKLGKCWHVMVTTYPTRDSNNPEKTLAIPEDLRVMVMVREMDDGSKQIRMILGDQEIHLQKSGDRLEATVNEQVANFSRHESYREKEAFEIYEQQGSITVFSLQYEILAVYDGERIRFGMSDNYLNAVRGLCGNYDRRSDNDFIIPKNCILTKPEEFAATYALTQENCQGPALENKRKAEQSTCIPRSYRPSDVISDREAGRPPTKNRRWGYH